MFKPEEMFKIMLDSFGNPLFKAGFDEFTRKAQQEGMEAAKKFWGLSDYAKAFPHSGDMLEQLTDWYAVMGFVPSAKHQQVVDENTQLKAENLLLKNMVKDLQMNMLTEGGEKAQQLWQDMLDKQIKMNTDAAKTLFEAMRQFTPGG